MRRFVVIGQKATSSPDFSLLDIPGTSGRIDVLLHCVRAALLVSHGVRRDTVVYLVMLGGPSAPKTVRVEGAESRFLRPDDRHLATVVKKALAVVPEGPGFWPIRLGVSIADGGLETVLADIGTSTRYVLEENARDLRMLPQVGPDPVFFVGDHRGFDETTRMQLAQTGAVPVGVGPISVHAEDAIAIAVNEMDRREAGESAGQLKVDGPQQVE